MKLVVGLGNPGPRYADTRHNMGFFVIDACLRRTAGRLREKFKGEFDSVEVGGERVVLLKPGTFMNLSGDSVRPALDFFQLETQDLVVIHDELDLALARVKVKDGGGHGGHNGLRSIIQHAGDEFARVRCGIGRARMGSSTSHVLSRFEPDEVPTVEKMIETAADAVEIICTQGVVAAMNRFNAPDAEAE